MSMSATALASDLAYITGDTTFAGTLTYGAVSVAGTVGAETRVKDIMAEGEEYVYEMQWVAAVSAFGSNALPDVHQAVSIGGVAYHIESRIVSPDGLCVDFALRRRKKL